MLVYLSVVMISYFAIGVVLMSGGQLVFEKASGVLDTSPAQVVQLIIGIGFLVASFAFDTKYARERAAARSSAPGSMRRWRERAMQQGASGSLIGLAVGAVLVEVASMLPYIAAIGIIGIAGFFVTANAIQGLGWI